MVKVDNPLIADETLERNPAVDLKLVAEVYRMSKELKGLDLWEETGSRVRSPFEIVPHLNPHGLEIERLISQGR